MPPAKDPRSRRGRPPRLSRDRIVDAGLELVDRKGLDGLTMRALAQDLKVDPMAVYRHVRNKEDLLGAMCDRLLVELDPIEPEAAWEPQVRRMAEQIRDRFAARPALLSALASAPVTAASLVIAGRAIDLLVKAGLSPAEANAGFGAVFSYVFGYAVIEASMPPSADQDELRAAVSEAAGVDDPPQLDAAIELMNGPGDFSLGLDVILDGLRARVQG